MHLLPTVSDVVPRLGDAAVTRGEIEVLIERAAVLLHAHTGGEGFEEGWTRPDSRLAAIIVDSVVRVVLNPERALAGADAPFGARPGSFGEWTLDELSVLTQYTAARRSTTEESVGG